MVLRRKGTFYKYTTETPVFAWTKALFTQDYYSGNSGYSVFTVAAGTSQLYVWRGNDVYDPDYTSSSVNDASIVWGAGFTQQFRQFCVYASKISVKGQFFNYSATNWTHNRVYLWPSDDLTTPTETSIGLNPRAQYRDLDPQYNSGNGGHFKFKSFAKTKHIMGRKVEEGYDPSGDGSGMGGLLGGVGVGAGPTSPWYWNIRFYNGYAGSGVPTPTTSASSYNVYMRVRITYYVKLFNRVTTTGLQNFGTNVPL